jgi:hypothetical protein
VLPICKTNIILLEDTGEIIFNQKSGSINGVIFS